MNIPRVLELAEKRVPTLCGVKHTSPELHSALNCSTVCGGKYQIYFGTEMVSLLLACLCDTVYACTHDLELDLLFHNQDPDD